MTAKRRNETEPEAKPMGAMLCETRAYPAHVVATSTGFRHVIHTKMNKIFPALAACAIFASFSLADSPPATVPATKTTAPSGTQAAVAGAKASFPAATPEVVTAVTRRIFPAVVRIDVAQETYS